MQLFFVTLIVLVTVNISYGNRASTSSIALPHPRYTSAGNPSIRLEYDCPPRAFAIEVVTYIAPASVKANWTALSQSVFQMNQCNNNAQTAYQPTPSTKPFKTAPEMTKDACQQTGFVHDAQGNDVFERTSEKPMKTIQAALTLTHTLRTVHSGESTLCITIRGGTYYLGTNATTSSSQIGTIALTSNDSNTVIENYQDEHAVLSGGTLLQLQCSVHTKTAAGGTVMKAQVPASVNLDQLNCLFQFSLLLYLKKINIYFTTKFFSIFHKHYFNYLFFYFRTNKNTILNLPDDEWTKPHSKRSS